MYTFYFMVISVYSSWPLSKMFFLCFHPFLYFLSGVAHPSVQDSLVECLSDFYGIVFVTSRWIDWLDFGIYPNRIKVIARSNDFNWFSLIASFLFVIQRCHLYVHVQDLKADFGYDFCHRPIICVFLHDSRFSLAWYRKNEWLNVCRNYDFHCY